MGMSERLRIAFLFAMQAEAEPSFRRFGATALDVSSRFPVRYHQAHAETTDVLFAVNGRDRLHGVDLIGTQAATLTTMQVIERHEPDVIISAGTAGGWERHGTSIGQVYLSDDTFLYHDRRVGIAGWEAYGPGSYPGANTRHLALALGLERGVITSGNSLDQSHEDRAAMMANNARAKDMEAAAVAWVAHEAHVPMFAIKAITDYVDHPADTAEQFATNFGVCTAGLADIAHRVADHLGRHGLADLATFT